MASFQAVFRWGDYRLLFLARVFSKPRHHVGSAVASQKKHTRLSRTSMILLFSVVGGVGGVAPSRAPFVSFSPRPYDQVPWLGFATQQSRLQQQAGSILRNMCCAAASFVQLHSTPTAEVQSEPVRPMANVTAPKRHAYHERKQPSRTSFRMGRADGNQSSRRIHAHVLEECCKRHAHNLPPLPFQLSWPPKRLQVSRAAARSAGCTRNNRTQTQIGRSAPANGLGALRKARATRAAPRTAVPKYSTNSVQPSFSTASA